MCLPSELADWLESSERAGEQEKETRMPGHWSVQKEYNLCGNNNQNFWKELISGNQSFNVKTG